MGNEESKCNDLTDAEIAARMDRALRRMASTQPDPKPDPKKHAEQTNNRSRVRKTPDRA